MFKVRQIIDHAAPKFQEHWSASENPELVEGGNGKADVCGGGFHRQPGSVWKGHVVSPFVGAP